MRFSTAIPFIIVAIALIQSLPHFIYYTSGDKIFYTTYLSCFIKGLSHGVWYPRWCMDISGGLGAPVFYLYFPLPYYITAIPHLISGQQLSIESLFACSILLASILSGFTSYYWLRSMVGEFTALIGAICYLFLPYRLELMFFRSAYNELWNMAFLPLVMLYTQTMLKGQLRDYRKLALSGAASLLSHIPSASIGLLCSFILLIGGIKKYPFPKKLVQSYAMGIILMLALAGFYLLPSLLIRQYTSFEILNVWANNFLTFNHIISGRYQVGITSMLTLIAWVVLALSVFLNRGRLPGFFHKMLESWIFIGILCIFLLFSISAPLWDLLNHLIIFTFPWRMQMGISLSLTVLLVFYGEFIVSNVTRKRWYNEVGILLAFLLLLSHFMLISYTEFGHQYFERALALQAVRPQEYKTIWTSQKEYGFYDFHSNPEEFFALEQKNLDTENVKLLSGKASYRIIQWNPQGIKLEVTAKTPSIIWLKQRYFPTWKIAGNPADASLFPQKDTGMLLLAIPASTDKIYFIKQDPESFSYWIKYANYLSLITLAFLLLSFLKSRQVLQPKQ